MRTCRLVILAVMAAMGIADAGSADEVRARLLRAQEQELARRAAEDVGQVEWTAEEVALLREVREALEGGTDGIHAFHRRRSNPVEFLIEKQCEAESLDWIEQARTLPGMCGLAYMWEEECRTADMAFCLARFCRYAEAYDLLLPYCTENAVDFTHYPAAQLFVSLHEIVGAVPELEAWLEPLILQEEPSFGARAAWESIQVLRMFHAGDADRLWDVLIGRTEAPYWGRQSLDRQGMVLDLLAELPAEAPSIAWREIGGENDELALALLALLHEQSAVGLFVERIRAIPPGEAEEGTRWRLLKLLLLLGGEDAYRAAETFASEAGSDVAPVAAAVLLHLPRGTPLFLNRALWMPGTERSSIMIRRPDLHTSWWLQ